eukprot:762424-Hanusia_phi.AAC.1
MSPAHPSVRCGDERRGGRREGRHKAGEQENQDRSKTGARQEQDREERTEKVGRRGLRAGEEVEAASSRSTAVRILHGVADKFRGKEEVQSLSKEREHLNIVHLPTRRENRRLKHKKGWNNPDLTLQTPSGRRAGMLVDGK